MEYDPIKPEKDFVKRTIEIAKKLKTDEYCTTLQINLLFGTIILPKSFWYQSLGRYTVKHDEIKAVEIRNCSAISLKVLLHCLRNGIVHWREQGNQNVTFDTKVVNGKNEIVKVTIRGSGKVNDKQESITVEFDVKNDGILHFMKKIYTYLK